jgi:hypothetical protein
VTREDDEEEEGRGGAVLGLMEKIEFPTLPRLQASARAFAAFSFLPRAGGEDCLAVLFLDTVAGGRGISDLELEPGAPGLLLEVAGRDVEGYASARVRSYERINLP